MNAPSVDIRHMLEDYGDSSGFTPDLIYTTNLFIGKEPAEPNNCVTIYDTPGFPPSLGLGGETGYEYPSIQIRVRHNKYIDGWNIANEIKDALHGRHHETWGGTLYILITCASGPALLDWDDNGRARFIINFNLQRR